MTPTGPAAVGVAFGMVFVFLLLGGTPKDPTFRSAGRGC
jgi:hypothetical protein